MQPLGMQCRLSSVNPHLGLISTCNLQKLSLFMDSHTTCLASLAAIHAGRRGGGFKLGGANAPPKIQN